MSERAVLPTDLARAIRMVVLDVDGVMTDGGIYLAGSESGERFEFKRFEITDGLGVKMLQWSGIEVAIVTGRCSEVVSMRARELGIEEVHQDSAARKLPIVEGMMQRKGLGWEAMACVADDMADLPVLRRSALPVAVANAVPEVRAVCRWHTTRAGGAGAIREFAETLLKARGAWVGLVDDYLRDRESDT